MTGLWKPLRFSDVAAAARCFGADDFEDFVDLIGDMDEAFLKRTNNKGQ